MESVSLARINRANERTAQDNLPTLQFHVIGSKFIGQPGDPVSWVVQNSRGYAGLPYLPVAETKGRNPAHIDTYGLKRLSAKNNRSVSGIIGNSVNYLAHYPGLRIDPLNTGIEDFQDGDDKICRIEDIKDGTIRPLKILGQYECQFYLHARSDEAVNGNIPAVLIEHIIQ